MEKDFRIQIKSIIMHDNKFLLLKKWYDDKIDNPYQWGFGDGKLEFGESTEEAAVRIASEVCGLNVVVDRLLYTWSFIMGEHQYIGIAHLCNSTDEILQLSEEYTEGVWVAKDQIRDYITNQDLMKDLIRVNLI